MLDKFIIAVLIIFLTFYSCKSDSDDTKIIINPLDVIEKEVKLSEFTNDITYIPLDNKFLFQHPSRIEVSKELFIMATFPSDLMVFDRQGEFRNKIGARGRGPGEYQSGLVFTIDLENDLVYIYDNPKIFIYTLDGSFVREFSISKYGGTFTDIHYSGGKIYLASIFFGRATYDWIILDTLGNLYSHKYNSIPEFKTTVIGRGNFSNYEGGILYWNSFNDTIFKIQDKSFRPAMYFAKGDFRMPHQDIPLEDAGRYFNLSSMIKTKNLLFLRYELQQHIYTSYMDKNEKELTTLGRVRSTSFIDLQGISNNIDGGPTFMPRYYFKENGEEFLIGWIHTFRLKAHVESQDFQNSTPKYPEKKKELEELAATLDENDNPVLMLVKLKD